MHHKTVNKLATIIFLGLLILDNTYTQSWTERKSLPAGALARNHPVTFTLDGKGYVATGNTVNNSDVFKDVWRYDPVSNDWEELDVFPGEARGYSYGIAYEGKGYLGFGLARSGHLKDLWEFDPSTEKWTQLPNCPCVGRTHPALVAHQGKIYVGAGGGQMGDLKDWWAYDLKSQTWSQKDSFPGFKRHHPFFFEVGEYIYVGFGHSGPFIFKNMFRYDPKLDKWQEVASLPSQGRVAGTQFTYKGKGYLLSGQGEDHQNLKTGEFWAYTPETDSWAALPPHPGSGRWAPGSFLIDGKIYLTSGTPDGGDVKDLWSFDLDLLAGTKNALVKEFNLFPNPANDHIILDTKAEGSLSVSIYNVFGQRVLNTQTTDRKISVNHLPEGVYTVHLGLEGTIESSKFLIRR